MTIFAQAGAALAWRARGDGAVEVLLLAAGRQDRGLGTMLAEALLNDPCTCTLMSGAPILTRN